MTRKAERQSHRSDDVGIQRLAQSVNQCAIAREDPGIVHQDIQLDARLLKQAWHALDVITGCHVQLERTAAQGLRIQ